MAAQVSARDAGLVIAIACYKEKLIRVMSCLLSLDTDPGPLEALSCEIRLYKLLRV